MALHHAFFYLCTVLLSDEKITPNHPPDLFKLITCQANVRLKVEEMWLDKYIDYLEIEDERRKEEEKKWREEHRRLEAEKREKAKKKKSQTKV